MSSGVTTGDAFAGTELAAPAPATAALLGRIERLPLSRWHLKARVIIGTATFFDGIDFLAIALALPVLAGSWHLSQVQVDEW
jgi:putative MFS transporter